VSGWKEMCLSEFCRIGSGGTPSRSNLTRYYEGGNIPWVKSGELRESVITKTEEHITEAALKETNARIVPAGALLLAMYGATVGRLGILGVDAATNQAVCHIIPDPKTADTRFLFQALSNQVPNIVARGVGGAQPNISQGIIKDLKLALPPLPKQRRIAEVLDKAEALRAKRRAAIAQLDSLTQSLFFDLFGDTRKDRTRWEIVPLEEIVKETKLGLVRGSQDFGPEFEIPYVRMNAVTRNGELELGNVQRTHATEAEIEAYRLKPGDFLFNTRNSEELVGKTALYRGGGLHLFNNNLMRVRFTAKADSVFVAAAFKTPFVQQELNLRKSGTTNVFAIYYKDLRSLPLPLPPIDLQREFARQVAAVEKLKAKQKESLADLDTLFSSLQQRAFSGQLFA
jgi:type I restriction enzyme S subunit